MAGNLSIPTQGKGKVNLLGYLKSKTSKVVQISFVLTAIPTHMGDGSYGLPGQPCAQLQVDYPVEVNRL